MTDIEHSTLYGLRISSELPLLQGRRSCRHDDPDLVITVGEQIAQQEVPPAGEQLLHFAPEDDEPYYSFARRGHGGYVLRFFQTCDFVLSEDLRRAEVRLMHDADVGVAGVLGAGALLSFVLAMQGIPVLHASAVQIADSGVAFVGYSGMGKSTMATLMCASGARLITDDVLRVAVDDIPRCRLGGGELRLRKAADDLAQRFDGSLGRRRTADQRDALAPTMATEDRLPLRAIIFPRPRRDIDTVAVQQLAPVEALLTLVRFPRLLGWLDETVQAQQFELLAGLAQQVPCSFADVPWGPPFAADVAIEIREQIDHQLVS
jgi:hypothetical protein